MGTRFRHNLIASILGPEEQPGHVPLFYCSWEVSMIPNMFSEKKAEKTPEVRSRDGHVEHVCKSLEPISQKRRGHLDFLCGKHVYFA